MRAISLVCVVAILAACSPSPEAPPVTSPVPLASPTPHPVPSSSIVLTSDDFHDGGYLPHWASADAFNGQCDGDNINPHLTWEGLPQGTESVAITIIDRSARDYVHAARINIDPSTTSLERGGWDVLTGTPSGHTVFGSGYFGPCPVGTDHHYEFTVWALDTVLDLPEGFGHAQFVTARQDHVLDSVTIVGLFSRS